MFNAFQPMPGSVSPGRSGVNAPIRVGELSAQCGGDLALITLLLQKFEQQACTDIPKIRESLAGGDLQQVARTSHALKGAAGALHATEVHRLAAMVEDAARASQLAASAQGFEALKSAVESCLASLPEVRAEVSGGQSPS